MGKHKFIDKDAVAALKRLTDFLQIPEIDTRNPVIGMTKEEKEELDYALDEANETKQESHNKKTHHYSSDYIVGDVPKTFLNRFKGVEDYAD